MTRRPGLPRTTRGTGLDDLLRLALAELVGSAPARRVRTLYPAASQLAEDLTHLTDTRAAEERA